jgi:alkylation response protein AidB-like acyl-CoA dehydrogenase
MISFALSEDQEIARAAAADFARSVLAPAARAGDEAAALPEPLLAAAWSLGIVQAIPAAEPGLLEQPTVLNALLLEELARGDAAVAVAIAAPLGFVKAVAEQGSERQRRELLPFFASDAPQLAAVAYIDAGWFQGAGRPTKAARVEGGFRLTGAKALIPLAVECGHLLATAVTDTGAEAFIVPVASDGVRIGPSSGTLGLRALAMADVVLDGVFVPDAARLGEDAGADVQRIVDLSRVALSVIMSGLSRAVFDAALPYAKERVVHGEALAKKQSVAFKLADMHIAIEAMRWMALRAAVELDDGNTATRSARLAQLYAAKAAMRIADEGVQIFGGHGFVRDLPLEMWCRNARSLSVLDGLIGA